jgi:flagellar secretion chaperone FliS
MSLARRYASVQNNTASKERLTVLLFEAALKNMRTAAGHLDAKRRSEAMPLLAKAAEIVTHLHATLRREAAPKLVDQLMELYTFTSARIVRAMATANAADVREAERAFAPIADGFAQAVAAEQAAQQAAQQAPRAAAK